MKYSITAYSEAKAHATVDILDSKILIGTAVSTGIRLPNPAELLLTSLAACILKNVERLSTLQGFEYSNAKIKMSSVRIESPTRMDDIEYLLTIYSKDKMNVDLLQRNIEEHGTIYNTIKKSATISGAIEIISDDV